MRIPILSGLCLSSLLLCPGILFAQSQDRRDSLAKGTVLVQHHPKRLIKLGREIDGGSLQPGSSRWRDFEIFWGFPSRSGDGTTFANLRPGKYSLWALDTAYRLVHESFRLGKGELRTVDARTGTAAIGKKAVATLVDKASKTPIPGALVHFKCAVPGTPNKDKLILHSEAVASDSLGGFEIPPCINEKDVLYVQYRVTGHTMRDVSVKITAAMDEDSLWRIGAIPLGEEVKPTYQEDKKPLIFFSALTYSMGFPLSDGESLHAFGHSLYSRYFGMDYGFEVPTGSLFVNLKGWIPSVPVLKGNWTLPLGVLGTGLGLYRTLEKESGIQVQAWYSLLLAHVNLKLRKDFGGSYHSTLGLGISLPVYIPGRK